MPIDIDGLRAALAGRYALERELGHGATATVYLAQDLKVPKKVAIKVLNPDIALAVTTERFRREIKNTAPLTHSHILGLSDADVAFDTQTGQEILYYVMPYVEGGSLGDRLKRDGPLPVKEAMRVAWEVADALAYAHARGVIHRDIKPGNILLSEGHAWVSDFGIARKLDDEGLTGTGRDLGTPPYMSPEQTAASGVDHRSDIYALGCVLYEMLAGTPPFLGPTSASIALQRLSQAAPSVRQARPTVPLRVERIVAKALAQKAEDRFQTAADFRDALGRPAWVPSPALMVAASVAAVGGLGWMAVDRWGAGRLTAADSLTYAVLPVAYADSVGAERLSSILHDELAKWTGITVVDQQRVREAAPLRATALTTTAALKAARRLKAGRYITVDASRLADSVRVQAVLHDGISNGTPLREGTVRVSVELGGADSHVGTLIDGLLFEANSETRGTRSFQARRAVQRGIDAVRQWDLDAADTAFLDGVENDPQYAVAHLHLALTRFWKAEGPPTWASSAQRAAAGRRQLAPLQQVVSDALLAFAQGDIPGSCRAWQRATHDDEFAFASWYGFGACLHADRVIVRDRRSLSGWRYRSSYYQALRAFQRAYELAPATHRRLSSGGYEAVRRLFHTGGNQVRSARPLAPDTGRFFGVPFWDGDSLVLVPIRSDDLRSGRDANIATGRARAQRRLREMFHEVAIAWRAADPESPSAWEALAISLELLGDRSCLDTLRLARRLAVESSDQLRLAAAEAWMRIKFAVPLDIVGLRAARALADSILDARPAEAGAEAPILSSLAALLGRAIVAASVAREVSGEWRAPGPIAQSAPALLAYAALGGPADSLRSVWRQVEVGLERIPATDREGERNEWLGRAATLAFPAYPPSGVGDPRVKGDYLVDAQAAFARGDTAAVRRILHDVRDGPRRANPPETTTLDALYPEAWLLAAIGDTDDAIRWLDPTLNAVALTAPRVFADPARAGALVRAMALRAELAERVGDRTTAARWARVVALLWSDADEFLAPTVREMERLVR